MKKILLIICVALIFPNIMLIGQPKGRFEQQREKKVIKLLKLTEEQQKKFEAISEQFKKNILETRATIEKNQIDLKKMVAGGEVDEKLLVQLTDQNSKLQGEMKGMAVKRWIEVNKMLDKDQKATWAKMLSKVVMMRENMKDKMKDCMKQKRHMREGKRNKGE